MSNKLHYTHTGLDIDALLSLYSVNRCNRPLAFSSCHANEKVHFRFLLCYWYNCSVV